MIIAPCGVTPKITEPVKKLMAHAAGMIGNFEANRFYIRLDQDFYDIDDTPCKQMLYIALTAMAHTWNALVPSTVEIRTRGKIENTPLDFLLLFTKFRGNQKVLETRAVVNCIGDIDAQKKEQEDKEQGVGDLISHGVKVLQYHFDEITRDPFAVADHVFRELTGSDWDMYELLKNNLRIIPLGQPA